jgi:hypothetical protein
MFLPIPVLTSKRNEFHGHYRSLKTSSVQSEFGKLFSCCLVKKPSTKSTRSLAPLVQLVTGCSSGFGQQFVHAIITRGNKVRATGRNAATRLQNMKNTGAQVTDLDVHFLHSSSVPRSRQPSPCTGNRCPRSQFWIYREFTVRGGWVRVHNYTFLEM